MANSDSSLERPLQAAGQTHCKSKPGNTRTEREPRAVSREDGDNDKKEEEQRDPQIQMYGRQQGSGLVGGWERLCSLISGLSNTEAYQQARITSPAPRSTAFHMLD